MVVATNKVQGRRTLRFESLDDVLADAQKVAASGNVKTLGNWPLEQLLAHLAAGINGSIDGISARAPWYIRIFAPFLKRLLLTKALPAGFNLPKEAEAGFFPAVPSPLDGLAMLQQALARLKTERMTAAHPVLGKLTHEEWTLLHLRHAELHLSFVHIAD